MEALHSYNWSRILRDVVNLALRSLAAMLILFALNGIAFADRLHLTNGTVIEVDEVWEDAQGVWYRRGGVTQFIERARVRRIERATREETNDSEENETATAKENEVLDAKVSEIKDVAESAPQTVWIYFVGGARVQADDVTETADGIWQHRGNLSVFLDRSRIERIERETLSDVASVSNRKWRELGWSSGNARIDSLIRQNGARYGVDPYLIFCVIEQESQFKPRAVSPKGARGLMQLMPGTAARFGVRNSFDAAQNIRGGTRYLKGLLDMFSGRIDLALASYNAGEGAVIRYGRRIPPYSETREYVKSVKRRYLRKK